MLLVVSDTSPIRALASVGLLDLLPNIYQRVLVPPAVAHELSHVPSGGVAVRVQELPFVTIRSPTDKEAVARFQSDVDVGEAEAISLALELSALLLIDEADGRQLASSLGIRITGVIGVLLEAKQRHLVRTIRLILDDLREEGRFFLSDQLYAHALQLSGE